MESVQFGMGCFWGVERLFRHEPGVLDAVAGYAGGGTPDPDYREVCTGRSGHAEVVSVEFDPGTVSFERLLRLFWEGHDPTQGMRQGNDVGSQYRSVVHCTTPAQHAAALASRDAYQARLSAAGYGAITTEVVFPAPPFHPAEPEHQRYLERNPNGYCGLGGTGVSCPVGTGA